MSVETLDLNFLVPGVEASPSEPDAAPVVAAPSVTETAPVQSVIDDISEILLPRGEDDEPAPAETKPKETATKPAAKTTAPPMGHNPQLMQLAASWGIGPDEAAGYATEDALLGQVAIRELRYRNEVSRREATQPKPDAKPKDELTAPEIEVAEDADPSIKAAILKVNDYAKQLHQRSEREISAMREQVDSMRSEHEQAAQRDLRAAEAKIASLFDEKVSSWGDEFKDMIGTPQETWRKPGTTQHAELMKLREYVRQRKVGYEFTTEREATPDILAGFMDEARHALWPDKAVVAARKEVAAGLRKQRGGVGLPPGRTRNGQEPAPQGRAAAVAALGEDLKAFGMGNW